MDLSAARRKCGAVFADLSPRRIHPQPFGAEPPLQRSHVVVPWPAARCLVAANKGPLMQKSSTLDRNIILDLLQQFIIFEEFVNFVLTYEIINVPKYNALEKNIG